MGEEGEKFRFRISFGDESVERRGRREGKKKERGRAFTADNCGKRRN